MSYPGSKGMAGTWQRILGQMPPHKVYVEPFAGSAQIFRRKRPAIFTALADKSEAVTDSLLAEFPGDVGRERGGLRGSLTVWTADALDVLRWLFEDGGSSEVLIYCDPPYLLSTRTTRRRYKNEMTDDQHASLLTLLQGLNCNVMISGYPSRLYAEKLRAPKWRCISYQTRTRGRTLTECLWCNFQEPAKLHDWRYAGRTYRERLALGRLANRWLARLEAMPDRKRNFVLHSLEQRHFRR